MGATRQELSQESKKVVVFPALTYQTSQDLETFQINSQAFCRTILKGTAEEIMVVTSVGHQRRHPQGLNKHPRLSKVHHLSFPVFLVATETSSAKFSSSPSLHLSVLISQPPLPLRLDPRNTQCAAVLSIGFTDQPSVHTCQSFTEFQELSTLSGLKALVITPLTPPSAATERL